MTSLRDHKTSGDGPITLITVFEMSAEKVEEFIVQWRVRAKIMAAAPGFRDAKLHRAVSSQARFQLVNVAHWDSQAYLDDALGNDKFQDRVHALQENPKTRFAGDPGVYEVVAVLGEE